MKRWKVCVRCGKRKVITPKNFHRYKRSSDGFKSSCKACCNTQNYSWYRSPHGREWSRNWKKDHREESNKARYAWRSNNPAIVLLEGVQKRSKEKGIQTDLTLSWIKRRLKSGVCEVTGVKFDLKMKRSSITNPYRPSVDRKNHKLGYTKRNSRIVCWWYNMAKGCWTDKLVTEMAKSVVRAQA